MPGYANPSAIYPALTQCTPKVQCYPNKRYYSQLAFLVFWPYALLLVCATLAVLYRAVRVVAAWRHEVLTVSADSPVSLWRRLLVGAHGGVVSVLPIGIFVTFMAYTSVCGAVFGAFTCEG